MFFVVLGHVIEKVRDWLIVSLVSSRAIKYYTEVSVNYLIIGILASNLFIIIFLKNNGESLRVKREVETCTLSTIYYTHSCY